MGQPAKKFEDLIVWQKAHGLVLGVYRLTAKFPSNELYGLTSQMRRAAVSIPANIAEGFGRRSDVEKARFYNIAHGSLEEVRCYLLLARDLKYGETASLSDQLQEVSRLLESYARAVRANATNSSNNKPRNA
jgi:four helix bundle protein